MNKEIILKILTAITPKKLKISILHSEALNFYRWKEVAKKVSDLDILFDTPARTKAQREIKRMIDSKKTSEYFLCFLKQKFNSQKENFAN